MQQNTLANPPAATHLAFFQFGLSTLNNWFVVVLAALAGSHQAPSLDWAEDHTSCILPT